MTCEFKNRSFVGNPVLAGGDQSDAADNSISCLSFEFAEVKENNLIAL